MLGVNLLTVQAVGGDWEDPVHSLGVGEGDEPEASAPLKKEMWVEGEWEEQVSSAIKYNFTYYLWSANIKSYYDIAFMFQIGLNFLTETILQQDNLPTHYKYKYVYKI